jgi:hypothetical protein
MLLYGKLYIELILNMLISLVLQHDYVNMIWGMLVIHNVRVRSASFCWLSCWWLTLSCLQVIGYACKVFRVLFNCHSAICTTLFLPIIGNFLPLYWQCLSPPPPPTMSGSNEMWTNLVCWQLGQQAFNSSYQLPQDITVKDGMKLFACCLLEFGVQ